MSTCRTMAAAPLRPPPSAFLRVAPRSNWRRIDESCAPEIMQSSETTHCRGKLRRRATHVDHRRATANSTAAQNVTAPALRLPSSSSSVFARYCSQYTAAMGRSHRPSLRQSFSRRAYREDSVGPRTGAWSVRGSPPCTALPVVRTLQLLMKRPLEGTHRRCIGLRPDRARTKKGGEWTRPRTRPSSNRLVTFV